MSSPSLLNDEVFYASLNACQSLILPAMRWYHGPDVSNDEGCSLALPRPGFKAYNRWGAGSTVTYECALMYSRSVKTGASESFGTGRLDCWLEPWWDLAAVACLVSR